ncbi:peptidoglycan DD-metalloendopeptidase family protein [Streptomyces sp. TRM66268-LWL]|uniref:Peptidoglycan DD-metalloendopeptidase family protein n=1 Tax=Streptomyces polyasparticus TaxID=2767826 RepID=A0ABR7SRF4_9ACTN|nr:peptidoglycan DD-metalloendopeptidase family protein [Streptomyces polyasparticus]MBC9717250.1 peptidoglycan DD-metalloendopeptidase family protein [Streptomyces polyasparticus]
MNEQHGYATGHGGYATGAFDTTAFDSDPLFGAMPGTYDAAQSGQWDSSQWAAGAEQIQSPPQHQTYAADASAGYGMYAAQPTGGYESGSYDTGGHDTTAMWASAGYQSLTDIPAQPGPQSAEQWDTTGHWQTTGAYGYADTGSYDATAWNSAGTDASYETRTDTSFETGAGATYETDTGAAYGADGATTSYETGSGTSYDTDSSTSYETGTTGGYESAGATSYETGSYAAGAYQPDSAASHPYENEGGATASYGSQDGYGETELLSTAVTVGHDDEEAEEPEPVRVAHSPRPQRSGSRGRRRTPAKRSALLTVAVPSVCALGVAGVAAASVAGSMGANEEPKTQAAPDPSSVETAAANNKLDTQLTELSADADDFADRASRTQERIDLKERQEAEKKRKAEEAARKEALRPKFSLPVKQHGLSAYYGQAGVNWMSVHSGIDFPVSYGTEVLAATDGTVRTQWNGAYGNMAIVTAPDGTETWYCHLSSTKIRSGSVKAGDVIAYSGNSGNSTGPHLHFEVRPGGGSAIDPLPWLRSHGLEPV